jgi:hypothetical protein
MQPTGTLTLGRDSLDPTRTLVVLDNRCIGSLPWQLCDEIADQFKRAATEGRQHAETGAVVITQGTLRAGPFMLERDTVEPRRTLIILGTAKLGSVDWSSCFEIAASFRTAARMGEEIAKAPQIIAQQALLTRTGAPVGLSNNRKIQDAAYTDAQWDSAARKGMPMRADTVPSARRCGTPSVLRTRKLS